MLPRPEIMNGPAKRDPFPVVRRQPCGSRRALAADYNMANAHYPTSYVRFAPVGEREADVARGPSRQFVRRLDLRFLEDAS
jgi:hypothetical protein